MTWVDTAADKVERLEKTIPAEWRLAAPPTDKNVIDYPKTAKILTDKELEITGSSAVELVAKITTGKLSAVEVTTAFSKRAAIAHQLTNCALELFPDVALERAKYLDDYYTKNGKAVGPLHGLPISLKDQFRIKGLETSMGYVSWIGKFETGNSTLVDLLLNAGAVLHVKTSVPQSLMFGETINNIIGRTVNPRNNNMSCGGSSGGEGALVSLRGSLIGVGTDIGGSVRIPAAFNFLYGLRPSHGRLPYYGAANSMAGQETIHSVLGPLCHSMADLRLFMTSVLEQQPWLYDSKVIPMPWRQAEEDATNKKIQNKSLTLGFYSFDGLVHAQPPIQRGVETAVSALKAAGHRVEPWKVYKPEVGLPLLEKIFAADGGADIYGDIEKSGEPALHNFSANVPKRPKMDLNDTWAMNLDKWQYQCEYLASIRKFEAETGVELDAIIAPVAPHATIKHDQYKYVGFSGLVNLLDFTSVVVPVTFADQAVDVEITDFEPANELDAAVQADYDAEVYHGAPVAVQVIGRRLSEEKTMAIAAELGRLLGNTIVS